MDKIKFGFSWVGFIIFMLPMIINIIYVIFPPLSGTTTQESTNKWIEIIEQSTRIFYFGAIVFLVKEQKITLTNIWFLLAALFLVLYYVVWIRYFLNGRDIAFLGKNFFFVPMPLAIFPVLYFIFAALGMHNYIAVVFMVIFGIAHNIISYASFG